MLYCGCKNSYMTILYLSAPANSHNLVTLIKVVIMRNVGNKMQSRFTFIQEWVHHRSLDSVYVRMRTRRWRRDGHLVYMEISNWHAPVSGWYMIRLGKKPLSRRHIGEWWMVKDGVNMREQKCNGRLDFPNLWEK